MELYRLFAFHEGRFLCFRFVWLNYLRFADETPARKRGRSLVRERLNRKPLLGYDLIRTRHGMPLIRSMAQKQKRKRQSVDYTLAWAAAHKNLTFFFHASLTDSDASVVIIPIGWYKTILLLFSKKAALHLVSPILTIDVSELRMPLRR